MTATPKQVRQILKKIYYHSDKLASLMSQAHDMDIIRYEQDKYMDQSPCATHYKTEERIDKTTEASLAATMRYEIRHSK